MSEEKDADADRQKQQHPREDSTVARGPSLSNFSTAPFVKGFCYPEGLGNVGVFGILAYAVQQHVRDFGPRRVLGATTNDILQLVMLNAARVIATGAAIGLVLSAVGGRLIEKMLFGVRPLDLTTFLLVTIVLAITTAIAIAGPAWRAVRIDPATALRNI